MNTISRTMVVSAISLVAGLLTMFGVTLSPETQATIAGHLDAVIGAVIALYGIVMGVLRMLTSTPLASPITKEPTQGGFARPSMLVALLALAILIVGCANYAKPRTVLEQVAYAEATAQGSLQSIIDLTCPGYDAAGLCTEPGKPLKADSAAKALGSISKARKALKATAALPTAGGDCLGEQRTPQQCLALATTLLGQVEVLLREQVKAGAK